MVVVVVWGGGGGQPYSVDNLNEGEFLTRGSCGGCARRCRAAVVVAVVVCWGEHVTVLDINGWGCQTRAGGRRP